MTTGGAARRPAASWVIAGIGLLFGVAGYNHGHLPDVYKVQANVHGRWRDNEFVPGI